MKNDIGILRDSLLLTRKVLLPRKLIPSYVSKRNECKCPHKNFIGFLYKYCYNSPKLGQSKYPLTGEWINKL